MPPHPARPTALGRWIAWVFLIFVSTLGAWMLTVSLDRLIDQEARLWTARPVLATVQSVALEDPRPFKSGGTAYRPVVWHTYRVGPREYTSPHLYPSTRHVDPRYARAALSVFKPGTQIRTYVPAYAPGEAFVIPKRDSGSWVGVLVGLTFLLPGVGLLLGRLRRTFGKPD